MNNFSEAAKSVKGIMVGKLSGPLSTQNVTYDEATEFGGYYDTYEFNFTLVNNNPDTT